MLIASAILNILLLLVLVYFVWALGQAKGFSDMCHKQWEEWECRYWNVAQMINNDTEYSLRIDGIKSQLRLSRKGAGDE
jgi:hypothetical protein